MEQNVWNNDMFCQVHSAKMKKEQGDTGTSIWGDPRAQLGVCVRSPQFAGLGYRASKIASSDKERSLINALTMLYVI